MKTALEVMMLQALRDNHNANRERNNEVTPDDVPLRAGACRMWRDCRRVGIMSLMT